MYNNGVSALSQTHSGLDALSAAIVVGVIRKIADEGGMTVVCTIHQPSRLIFETFDKLLLLQVWKARGREGRGAYMSAQKTFFFEYYNCETKGFL